MADQSLAGSEPRQDDDLRATLDKAWETAESAPAPAEAPQEQAAPEGETAVQKTERERDEKGRFAKANEAIAEIAAKAVTDATAAVAAPPAQQQPVAVGPPPGWSVAAKAAFDKADPAIKAAVAQREQEVNNGLAKLAEYKGVDPYVEIARREGTTLPEVLDRYIAAENLLANDFVSGVRSLCQMYQIHPAQLAQALGGQPQQGNQNPQQHDPFAPVMQKMTALEQIVQGLQQQRDASEDQVISGHLNAFAAKPENKFFENVKGTMGKLMEQYPDENQTLEQAYENACWMNPEIRALRINDATEAKIAEQRRVADQNRRASGSLQMEAPGKPKGTSQPSTLRASLENAWDAQSSI